MRPDPGAPSRPMPGTRDAIDADGGAEGRLRSVPWRALAGIAPSLDAPIAAVLRGESAERVVDRTLKHHRQLDRIGRAAVAEALFGVAVWRRRLAYQLGRDDASPRMLLASLLRDLGGLADGAAVAGLLPCALPDPRPPPIELADRYSLPPWLAATLVAEAGDDAELLADALGQPGPVCLRPNGLRTSAAELALALQREGVVTRAGRIVPTSLVIQSPRPNVYGLRAWRDGAFEVQDEGSQLVGALVAARPGDEVLDLCAGAGGKTLQLAAAVGASGLVHAADPDQERLERLERRASRAGATSIVRIHGAHPPPGLSADRVLVDAPCSELGALRRGPDARFRLDPRSFERFPSIQLGILEKAVAHLRDGGRLVYATCTFRREENEAVALAFERAHPGLRRVTPRLDVVATPGSFIRTWPHRHGCDGFFVAIWERPDEGTGGDGCDSAPRPP